MLVKINWGFILQFHAGYSETVLFDQWKFTTVGGLIGSMIGIFFMAALYEGLKYYRWELQKQNVCCMKKGQIYKSELSS